MSTRYRFVTKFIKYSLSLSKIYNYFWERTNEWIICFKSYTWIKYYFSWFRLITIIISTFYSFTNNSFIFIIIYNRCNYLLKFEKLIRRIYFVCDVKYDVKYVQNCNDLIMQKWLSLENKIEKHAALTISNVISNLNGIWCRGRSALALNLFWTHWKIGFSGALRRNTL